MESNLLEPDQGPDDEPDTETDLIADLELTWTQAYNQT